MLTDLTHSSRIEPADLPNEEVIFGSTAAMQEIRKRIDCAIRDDRPVMILGESGTGKEVIAKYLHTRSGRADAPFVKINCVAFTGSLLQAEIPDSDIELESSMHQTNRGLEEVASAGTLFLDEISDLDWKLQAKLVRLLLSRFHARIGENEEGRARVRIICSTRIDAEAAVLEQALHRDQFAENDLIRVHLPALRERKQDIPRLCEFLMEKQAMRFGKNAHQLTQATMQLLKQWQWPGNLRELENWIARVVILGSQEVLAAELRHQVVLAGALDTARAPGGQPGLTARHTAPIATQAAILKVLQAHGWSRRRKAEELRISYRALLYRLRDANVPRRRRSHREPPPTQ
jgi:two-component system, NtrC family, response regulator AtoC